MKDQVKVSVVIPVYNVEQYLRACLDSVLAQTLQDIEIICVDDASPDSCPQILDEYAEREPRVTVIHLPKNSQQAFARNRGMEIASGKYLYLLDSDDLIEPETLEYLYALAEKDDLDVIFFDSQVIYDSEELRAHHANYPAYRTGNYEDKIYTGIDLFKSFIRQDEWTCYVQRQFWRMDFLRKENVYFPEGHEHEDEVFPFEGLLLAERARYIPEQFFIRRYRENSVMTSGIAPKNFYGYFMCYLQMIEFLEERNIHCVEADFNVARMYDKMIKYYPMLKEQYNLEEQFKTPEEKQLYQYFRYSQDTKEYYAPVSHRLIQELKQYTKVYIYGAGQIGKVVLKALLSEEIVPEAVIVTDKTNQPEKILGIPVKEITEVDDYADAMVVVSASKKYADEIMKLLENRSIPHVYRRQYQIEG